MKLETLLPSPVLIPFAHDETLPSGGTAADKNLIPGLIAPPASTNADNALLAASEA